MDDRLAKGIDRRTFLRMLGIASGALFVPGAVACGGGSNNTPTTSGGASTSAATSAATSASTATSASSGTGSIASPSAAVGSPSASPAASTGGSSAYSSFEAGAKVTADIPFYNGTLTVDMLQNPQGLDPQVNSNN